MDMIKKIEKLPQKAAITVIFAILFCVLISVISLRINASSMGNGVGQNMGSLAGRAIGSMEGLTKGRNDGTQAGKNDGLSAEDTEAEVANALHDLQNLEVLVASVKVQDIHSIGVNNDYKALYLMKGEVVFSVDMNEAEIVLNGDNLTITIPMPKGELIIDQSQVEKVAEYQRHYFKGDAESGFTAYLNSMTKVQEATAETLNNYSALLEAAKSSATNQIEQIANAAAVNKKSVYVSFIEPEE